MKSYTDLSQSRKLAEILPLKSADMFWYLATKGNPVAGFNEGYNEYGDFELPCWSLAALLNVLEHPRCFQGGRPTYWFCGCSGKDKLYHEVEADNPVDACYEMILKLHELKLL